MNTNPLEKVIEKKVCDYAKSKGCLTYKFTSPSQRSVPDRIIITSYGEVLFVEFKRKGCVPTPAQTIELCKIKAKGVTVRVIDSVEAGKAFIDACA